VKAKAWPPALGGARIRIPYFVARGRSSAMSGRPRPRFTMPAAWSTARRASFGYLLG
jgi:hypothetical protein